MPRAAANAVTPSPDPAAFFARPQRGVGRGDAQGPRQGEQYARALPPSEGRPPLLIVVGVGHNIELYSEFTRIGGTYVPFPDLRSHPYPSVLSRCLVDFLH